mmetsp:Transcript_33707/g.55665  ORF Transcript_33707/g.55665 Transcript_33707/m.55665 type:complete len:163 (+) Transcript_33707:67-555(+)
MIGLLTAFVFSSQFPSLSEFFLGAGFKQYASEAFLAQLAEELAYDSIEDLLHLMEDEEWDLVGMPLHDAVAILGLAQRHVLADFLGSLGLSVYAEPLYALGYQEVAHLADLEKSEAQTIGMPDEAYQVATQAAGQLFSEQRASVAPTLRWREDDTQKQKEEL